MVLIKLEWMGNISDYAIFLLMNSNDLVIFFLLLRLLAQFLVAPRKWSTNQDRGESGTNCFGVFLLFLWRAQVLVF